MTLQAIFDDSGTKGTGRFMSMAGLLGPAERIASVADAWDKHRRARHPGSIRYFKMDEAWTLNGEFNHWEEKNRDEKIRQMAGVIDRDDLFAISATIDLPAFYKVFADWQEARLHHAFSQPYMFLAQFVLAIAVDETLKRGNAKPLEIVYDEHNKFGPILRDGYRLLLMLVGMDNPARRAVMPIQPWFRDDQEFVMLQAADLIAGESRLLAEQDPAMQALQLCPNLKASGYFKTLDETALLGFKERGR